MAQWVKVLAMQAWQTEFHPWNLGKGRGKEQTQPGCPLISSQVPWDMHRHTLSINKIKTKQNLVISILIGSFQFSKLEIIF